jgi:hypothetical protein
MVRPAMHGAVVMHVSIAVRSAMLHLTQHTNVRRRRTVEYQIVPLAIGKTLLELLIFVRQPPFVNIKFRVKFDLPLVRLQRRKM